MTIAFSQLTVRRSSTLDRQFRLKDHFQGSPSYLSNDDEIPPPPNPSNFISQEFPFSLFRSFPILFSLLSSILGAAHLHTSLAFPPAGCLPFLPLFSRLSFFAASHSFRHSFPSHVFPLVSPLVYDTTSNPLLSVSSLPYRLFLLPVYAMIKKFEAHC